MAYLIDLIAGLPRFRGKGRLLSMLLPFAASVRSYYGVKLTVARGDLTNLYSIGGFYGDLIASELAALADRTGVFLDVGANAGVFSLLAARRLSAGRVFAFEPNPATYAQLLRNIALNDARTIVPLNLALGERSTLMALSHDPAHSGLSRVADAAVRPATPEVVVAVTPLDALGFVLEACRGRRVSVKVDVEGYELRVLRMLLRSPLSHSIDIAIVEIDAANLAQFVNTPEELYAEMGAAGFVPAIGLCGTGHYDEIFRRAPDSSPSRTAPASTAGI
jgi:FkbM family methyltransferase